MTNATLDSSRNFLSTVGMMSMEQSRVEIDPDIDSNPVSKHFQNEIFLFKFSKVNCISPDAAIIIMRFTRR